MENKNGMGLTTQETIDLAMGINPGPRQATSAAIKTGLTGSATTAGGYLYGYPLEAPAKKLYFIEDALRRRIPRKVNEQGGVAAHWKVITAINASSVKAGVAEGAVATALTPTTAEKSQSYRTLNQYNTYTDEARFFGRKFEDIPQLGMLMTLQSLMIQEDRYLLGGSDVTINKPTTVTGADSGTATVSGMSTQTYYVWVSALTLHGYLNGATGHASTDATDETDATAISGGVSMTSGHSMTVTVTDVPGAAAYNVYIAATNSIAAAYYQGTYTTNLITVKKLIASGNVPNTSDATADQYGYEGILQQLVALTGTAGSTGSYGTKTAYYLDNAGVAPTADGAGGCVEVETAIQNIWNKYRVSPTVFIVNSQEGKSLKKLTIGSSSSNAVRVTINEDSKNKFVAGSAVDTYWNPYTQQLMEIVTSVHCPPGKLFLLGESVPYPNAETPNNFEVDLQQEYYGEMFARTIRQTPVGVTCIGALKVYLPGACGILANLAAA